MAQHPQDSIDRPRGRHAGTVLPAGRTGDGSGPPSRRTTMWLQAGLLAVAPLLVLSFYNVVDGAVERAAERAALRHVAPAARSLQTGGLRPVAWECSVMPGAGVHSACRPTPVGSATGGQTAGS